MATLEGLVTGGGQSHMFGELVAFTSDLEWDDDCCCCDTTEESHKSDSSFIAESGNTDEEEKHLLVPEVVSSVDVGFGGTDSITDVSVSAERGAFNLHEEAVTVFVKPAV